MKNLTLAVALAAAAVTISACASPTVAPAAGDSAVAWEPQLEPYVCEGADRVHAFNSVFLASQPDDHAFAKAAEQGIKTVINLRMADDNGDSERALVEGLGMRYFNVPVSKDTVSDEAVARVREVLDDPANHAIMIHCSSANRVGMVWMALRATRDGLSLAEAEAEGRAVGLRTPVYVDFARDYIRRKNS